MRVERVVDAGVLPLGAELFDGPLLAVATERFLEDPGHHVLFAFDADDRVVGLVTGVETTHPDKGTEMFLYELGVAEDARRHGVGAALVAALVGLARERGCYGMWVAVDADNEAALATYRRAGGGDESSVVTFGWEL